MSEEKYYQILSILSDINIDLETGVYTGRNGSNGHLSKGYLKTTKNGINFLVHQAIAVKIWGKVCIGKQVNHKDGNKLNNNPTNLELVSPKENIYHAWENNLCRETKKVLLISEKNSSVRYVFNSAEEAAKKLNLDPSSIRKCINGYKGMKKTKGWFCFEESTFKEKLYLEYFNSPKPNSKKIIQIDKNTNDLISIFSSAKEASNYTGIDKSAIAKVANKKRTSAGNFKWEWVENGFSRK